MYVCMYHYCKVYTESVEEWLQKKKKLYPRASPSLPLLSHLCCQERSGTLAPCHRQLALLARYRQGQASRSCTSTDLPILDCLQGERGSTAEAVCEKEGCDGGQIRKSGQAKNRLILK